MIRRFALTLAQILGLALLGAAPLSAGPSNGLLDAQILPGWRLPDGRHVAAISLKLAPGWKTYWRTPGEAGIPPRFDWSRSGNLDAVQVDWPTPHVYTLDGLQTIGYKGRVVLPLTLTPAAKGQPITLNGEIHIGVCSDICMPVTMTLSRRLDATDTRPDPRIVAALASQPYSAKEAGLRGVTCHLSPVKGGLRLKAQIDLAKGTAQTPRATVVETGNPDIWVSQPQMTRKGSRLTAETELFHVEGRSFAFDRSGLRITLLDGDHAVDIQGCPAG